jgi:hypothetical protein
MSDDVLGTQPLRILDQETIERIFAITDAFEISREAVRVPLAGEGAGRMERRPDGVWEIVLPASGDFGEFLARLEQALADAAES